MYFKRLTTRRSLIEIGGALLGGVIATLWLLPSLLGKSAFFPADYWFRFSQWTPKYHELYDNVPFNGVLYDVALHLAPLLWIAREAWGNFELPLWNPYFRCGMPLLGNGQSGILSLTNIPHWLLPWPMGFAGAAIARFAIMWAGAWAFARSLGINKIAALTVAFGFCFMPAFMSWFQHPNANGEIFFPWLLWSVECIRRRWPQQGPGAYLLFPGLFFALALLGGHFHSTFNIIFCTSLYALLVLPLRPWRALLLSRTAFGISVIIGFLLAAPTVFPALAVMLDSSTLVDRSKGGASWHLTPEMLQLFWNPFTFGTSVQAYQMPWSTEANWAIVQQYIGLVPWALLLAGIARGTLLSESMRITLLGLFLMCTFAASLAYGWYPLHNYLTKVPPFSINTNPYFAIGVQATIIVLAALLWQSTPQFHRAGSQNHLYLWSLISLLTVGLSLLLLFIPVLATARPKTAFLAALFAVLTLWLCRGQMQVRLAWAAVFICLVCDVLPVWKDYHYQVPKEWAMPRGVESKVVSELDTMENGRVISDACYAPNTLAFFDIEDVRAYDSPIHARHTMWRNLITNEGTQGIDMDNLSTPQLSEFKSLSILSQTASTGLVSLVDYTNHPFQKYLQIVAGDGPVRLYKVNNPITKAAVYTDDQVNRVENTTAALTLNGAWDLSHPYYPTIEASTSSSASQVAAGVDTATFSRETSRRIIVKTMASKDTTWVVIRESFDKGWKARVGDKKVEIFPADIKFMAVQVPSGETEVILEYFPSAFGWGLFANALGLIGSIGYLLFLWRKRGQASVL